MHAVSTKTLTIEFRRSRNFSAESSQNWLQNFPRRCKHHPRFTRIQTHRSTLLKNSASFWIFVEAQFRIGVRSLCLKPSEKNQNHRSRF
uniref:Uncharacterized protein n=1 Tax=Physcomitrium patens TaxID=3218 RepID=A0A2K1IZ11_PHYPA|nr:hypothetical protein PHYPA_024330 [Physcomitrium patens]